MAIKKSSLEKKWYYRLAKIIVYLLPFGAISYFYFSQKLKPLEFFTNQQNLLSIGVGLVVYCVVVAVVWRIFLYLFFGGLEDDIQPKSDSAPMAFSPSPSATQTTEAQNGALAAIILLGVIVFIIATVFSSGDNSWKKIINGVNTNTNTVKTTKTTKNKNNNKQKSADSKSKNTDSSSSNQCVPTGCGSLWHCSGSYYLDGVKIPVDGCFPTNLRPGVIHSSWSGTCRQ
ncbi:MAG: hypothetical protein FJZ04_00165 [Candidatus Moranbacteria bacterium]|nr:hypothetical protein [Candidatus Moranbacteria bacterium]